MAGFTFLSASTLVYEFDYEAFVKAYYDAAVQMQQPDATAEDLEHYLSF
ncbi:hypothetical protein RNAN_0313 [Rheinheimera nanhaiensis E407-8]|uniref:Uncharacterized protein n=1 Tax=Rheinheimera nanhaiensis E407-8 TaxID=562729 RepID=I1DTH2_9GAMM|nr:hypothetical protein RNAN_0313 [Rheinheimera nanhaiensis E407-8]